MPLLSSLFSLSPILHSTKKTLVVIEVDRFWSASTSRRRGKETQQVFQAVPLFFGSTPTWVVTRRVGGGVIGGQHDEMLPCAGLGL
mmetsp:Transcript_21672/g.51007  ORF Transcript_21672/g.51007 Transcript_21672/m.51007 type:complete len:86 (+) Transcript_21672:1329-1586(+)